MFDTNAPSEITALLSTSHEFRKLYHQHQKLDRQVTDAQLGVQPLDATTLRRMKFEKLAVREQLERWYDEHQHAPTH
ncbi:MAG: YdcH family protein [Lysobacteraceae bacterium]